MMASIIDDCRQEMTRTIAVLKKDFARLRTSRATPALLDGITVDYYGAKTPLNQLASVVVPEPRLLVIQPFDRSGIGNIERAVLQSDLGLTPPRGRFNGPLASWRRSQHPRRVGRATRQHSAWSRGRAS